MPLPSSCAEDRIPARGGVGLKAEHYRTIVETLPDVGFFEVHAENYMGAGGPPHRYLSAIRERYPLSLHGVGLSIGADRPLDKDHLQRLKELIERYRPGLFSEHLAWSSHDIGFLNDLLPVPYTAETLARVVEHIDHVQHMLGLRMLLENPSTYLAFAESTYSEIGFIAEVVRRTGCGLLLDVNNVYVASTNQLGPLRPRRRAHGSGSDIDRVGRRRAGVVHAQGRSRPRSSDHARNEIGGGAPCSNSLKGNAGSPRLSWTLGCRCPMALSVRMVNRA